MKILGLVCAREGSKGVKNKNFLELGTNSIFERCVELAIGVNDFCDIAVSTDSLFAIGLANKYNLRYIFNRPKEISNDTANKWDVFRHAVLEYEKLSYSKIDYLVDMDVTVPLKILDDITSSINIAKVNQQCDVVVTAFESDRNPYFNIVEKKTNNFYGVVCESKDFIQRRQDAPVTFNLSPACYVIKRSALFDFNHWSECNIMINPIPRERAIDIDSKIDFEIISALYNKKSNE
jgi:N-acylneuraminate cytidylyltransferase/CMP-N,N'-diacetyllegionaminic acid synthase